jgi:gliding motility-associated-like protein
MTVQPVLSFTPQAVIYRYLWEPSSICVDDKCNEVINLLSGNYSVSVIVSSTITSTFSRQDTIRKSFVVSETNFPCDVTIFNAISANGDGSNDVMQIENIELYPKNKITFYNRWGTKVYEVQSYNNKSNNWPNAAQLDFLESTTYFYIIDLGDGSEVKKGWIEIIKN